MAATNPPGHGRPDEDRGGRSHAPLDRFDIDSPSRTLQAFAFWVAVVLPFLHVPLLTMGLTSAGERNAFLVLLALNALALYAGHPYGRERPRERRVAVSSTGRPLSAVPRRLRSALRGRRVSDATAPRSRRGGGAPPRTAPRASRARSPRR